MTTLMLAVLIIVPPLSWAQTYASNGRADIRAFGAADNGSTDDTAAVQAAITYGRQHNVAVYFPAPGPLITRHLDATCTGGQRVWLIGDGDTVSIITHALTEAYPVIDIGGCRGARIEKLGIQPKGQILANSQATACILDSNGTGDATAGGGTIISEVNGSCSHSSTTADLALINVDNLTVEKSTFGGSGTGSGLVVGWNVGHATGIRSAVYGAVRVGGNTTNVWFDHDIFLGDHAPPVQLTGSAEYDFSGGYVARVGTGTGVNSAIVDMTGGNRAANYLSCRSWRTENQGSSTSLIALYYEESITGGSSCEGSFNSDSSGAVLGGTTGLTFSSMHLVNSGTTNAVFSFTGTAPTFFNSSIAAGYAVRNLGTVPIFNGGQFDARSIAIGTLKTVGGSGTWLTGINGAMAFSGSINATGYQVNGTTGVTCKGRPSVDFAVVNGLVTHC